MKVIWGLLLGGLVLFSVPTLTLAHGGARNEGQQQYRGWVKERHEQGHYQGQRRDHKRQWQAKKHVRQHRHAERKRKQQYRQRPYYAVYSVPNIIFRINW